MKVITVTLATLILATITTEARNEVQLQCIDQEIGIRWPSYNNNADYYVCQGVGGKLLKVSCPDGDLFTFVLQVCSSPSKHIPAPPMDELPTASPSVSKPVHWNPVQVVEPYIPPIELPKPLMPNQGEPHLPTMPHLPHLPNGPKPPTVDLPGNYHPTDINSPPYVTDEQKPGNSEILPPPIAVMPQPPAVVKPPMPANKPGSGSQKPMVKPVVPRPPTPAPTPPLVKMTTTKPLAVKPVKPLPPSPPKKVMPKVPVKVKQN